MNNSRESKNFFLVSNKGHVWKYMTVPLNSPYPYLIPHLHGSLNYFIDEYSNFFCFQVSNKGHVWKYMAVPLNSPYPYLIPHLHGSLNHFLSSLLLDLNW